MTPELQPMNDPRQGTFCRVCGRASSSRHKPFCVSCTDIFALPYGVRLYDSDTGAPWFRSDGEGRLINPLYWDPDPAGPPSRHVTAHPAGHYDHYGWMVVALILGLMLLRGCASIFG